MASNFKFVKFIFGSTPIDELLSTEYIGSTAYNFCADRVLFIIANVLGDLDKDSFKIPQRFGEGSSEELKEIIGMLPSQHTRRRLCKRPRQRSGNSLSFDVAPWMIST